MSDNVTQPIDRRILAAAERAIAREKARKSAEAEAVSQAAQAGDTPSRATKVGRSATERRDASRDAGRDAGRDAVYLRDVVPAESRKPPLRADHSAPEPSSESCRSSAPASEPIVRGADAVHAEDSMHGYAGTETQMEGAFEDSDYEAVRPSAQKESVSSGTAFSTGAFLDAFFSELDRCGVRDYVVSPGSRSTPLAMKALEHFGDVYMDVDERGAAFFALGLAKATGNPVAVICTSGTAVGNWLPAVLEAESSRVPLLLLSGDRPARLQQVGAPQTCDQLNMFGSHVKKFVQMPLPTADAPSLAYARQMALDACIVAHGAMPGAASCDAGPVHMNFPFDEPLKPAPSAGPAHVCPLPPTVVPGQGIVPRDAMGLFKVMKGKRTIALCGEGSCNSEYDAHLLLEFARKRNVPLLADPLSGLRCYDDPMVIDNYDTVFGEDEPPVADVVIRFGRWPVSKRCCQTVAAMAPVQIVVDMRDTRDLSTSTSLFVRTSPAVFAQAMCDVHTPGTADPACAQEWKARNDAASQRIGSVVMRPDVDGFEGAYVGQLIDIIPENSLLFSANSMSIRALDTFYCKRDKTFTLLCNRGLNGIDGTVSSALGAAQAFDQTTLLIGDLAMLHDANALALQNELRMREMRGDGPMPSIIIVVLNNNGGGIFDMLPQKSNEDYFERLFLTPQEVDFKHLAAAFGAGYRTVSTVHGFRRIYSSLLGEPGISIIDVPVPLAGLSERYKPYQ